MSNNSINTRAIDSLKNILITSSQYNFEKEYIDKNNVEQYVQTYYSDLESNESSRLKLKDFVNKFAQTLNIDLNDSRIAVSFATIDATFDNSSLDGLIESVSKKIEFIEDMSYAMQNTNNKTTEKEENFIDNKNTVDAESKTISYIKSGWNYGKEITSSIKNFLSKQKHKVETFIPNKDKIKEIGNKVLEKIGITQKEVDVSDRSTLVIEHLLKIKELRDAGVVINDKIEEKIKDPNFDKDAIIKEFLDNPQVDKINTEPDKNKSEDVSIENDNGEGIKLDEKTKPKEIEYKDVTIISEDNIRIYKKDVDGKCFSTINHNGNPWGKYKEVPIEEFNKVVESSISKEYDKISNVVKNPKGEIIGVSETFTLYNKDLDGNIISGTIYNKDINGNYTVGLDCKGTQWGARALSQEEYNKALSQHLSLTNEASADYLKDANLDDLINKFNKEQIEKEEVAKDEVIKEEVVNDEVVEDEVVNDEVVEDEVVNDEVVEEKISNDTKTSNIKKENTFDAHSVNSFTVKDGKYVHKYFKDEKGQMFKQFIFDGLPGRPVPIQDTQIWENEIQKSVEFSAEFNDIEMEAQEIGEESIEVEPQAKTNKNIDYEDVLGF